MDYSYPRLTTIIAISCLVVSCKRDAVTPMPSPAKSTNEAAVSLAPATMFAPGQHNFTSVHICYDDKALLPAGEKLKELIADDLVDIVKPPQ